MQSEDRNPRDDRRESGMVMVLAALMITALMAFAALAVDAGIMMTARTQLQASADAAARAGIQELRDSGNDEYAKDQAAEYARANRAFNRPVELEDSDVEVGHFNYQTQTFLPGFGFGAPAVRVTARATEGSPTGPMPLLFSRVIGRDNVDVTAAAIASVQRRDVCISQDRTYSFVTEFPDAQAADRALVNQMEDQGLSGDRIGIVSFARDRIDEADMTELTRSGVSDLEHAIDDMQVCTGSGPPGGACYGTDIALGIDGCREMLEDQATADDAEQVIVVVSDGTPCIGELLPGITAITVGQDWATEAADRAGNAGMNIFVVTLDQGGGSGCFAANPVWNETLVRGFGRGFTTTNPSDLDDLLLSILTQMPVYLVQ